MMLACVRQRVMRRAVTMRLTWSAFSRREPRRKRMSRTVGVVCAIAENNGERDVGRGDDAIALSKYWNNSVGLFVLAHKCGRIGHSHELPANT